MIATGDQDWNVLEDSLEVKGEPTGPKHHNRRCATRHMVNSCRQQKAAAMESESTQCSGRAAAGGLRVPIANRMRRVGWDIAKMKRNRDKMKQRQIEVLFDKATDQQLWQTIVLMARAVAGGSRADASKWILGMRLQVVQWSQLAQGKF